MKTSVVLAFLVAGGLAASAAAQQQPAGSGRSDRPPRRCGAAARDAAAARADRAHQRQRLQDLRRRREHAGRRAARTASCWSTPRCRATARPSSSEVKKVTDKPIKLIINTHSHPDHVGSNDYIREQYPNVRIVMNEGAKEELSGPRGNPKLLPTETYKDHMTIGTGADRIELYHFGRGHTNGDTFVCSRRRALLCMGDVMAWNMAPFLPAGGAEADRRRRPRRWSRP